MTAPDIAKKLILHNLEVMDCVNESSYPKAEQLIDDFFSRKYSIWQDVPQNYFKKSDLTRYYIAPFLLIKDIINLCKAVRNDPHDLVLSNWFTLSGSLLTNSRPCCVKMKDRKYFHVYEIPLIIKGQIGVNGPTVQLQNGGLPEGFFPITNPDNYKHLCNGRACGHELLPVFSHSVPDKLQKSIILGLNKLLPDIDIPV